MLLGMPNCMALRPVEGQLARRAGRRFIEQAYWYAELLGLLHCMPLRPV